MKLLNIAEVLVVVFGLTVISNVQAHEIVPADVSPEFVEFTQDIIQAHKELHEHENDYVDYIGHMLDIEDRIILEYQSVRGSL